MKKNNFKNIIKTIIISLSVFILEISNSFAQMDDVLKTTTLNFKETANNITNNVLTSATTLLMTAAFVVFFYGVVLFIYHRSNGDDAKLVKDREAMLWGLLALFTMVSVWGVIRLVQGFFGIQNDNNIQVQSVSFTPPPSITTSGTSDQKVNTIKGDFNTVNENTKPTINDSKLIDQYLNQYKCFPAGINSIGTTYESGGTDSAYVVAFQSANNLSPTGVIDKATWDAFKSNNANNCKDNSGARPLVIPGTTLNYQTANLIDKYLNQYKCFPSGINTIGITYDDGADSGYVKNFQKANKLRVDGKIGKDTWTAFDSNTAKSCQ